MSKSALYATNPNAGTALAADADIPFTTILRRYGPNINLADGAVVLNGCGYYLVNAIVTLTATVVTTNLTVSIEQDGNILPGSTATATPAAAGDEITIPVCAIIRVTGCESSEITVSVGSACTSYNATITVEKL